MTAGSSPGPSRIEQAAQLPDSRISLADALAPMLIEQVRVTLPSTRREVQVPVYVRQEVRWRDALPPGFDTVPNKSAYAFDGAPLYPELLVVRLLERAGWGAAWRKNWGGEAYWRAIREPIEPTALARSIVDQVSAQAGHTNPWEIIAWRGRELRLITSRSDGGQPISAYQAGWLDAALRMGIPLGCFAVVQHQADQLPRRRQAVSASRVIRPRPGQPGP